MSWLRNDIRKFLRGERDVCDLHTGQSSDRELHTGHLNTELQFYTEYTVARIVFLASAPQFTVTLYRVG